jgi:predicted GH43/DUF377 family glycosyl hydrolase
MAQPAAASPRRPRDRRGNLLVRHEANPLLTAADWPYQINTVFNAGACRLPDGQTLLLCRVEECSGRSHLCAARSDDGVNGWRIDRRPTLLPDAANHPQEVWGIEDPRVVWCDELEVYLVTYTSFSRTGPGVSMAMTEDFVKFERVGVIMPPEDKDASMFPRRVASGRWAMLHRPVSARGLAAMWVSFSPDLKHWGDHTLVIEARRGPWWDCQKVGLSPPPIETPEGWLILFHGVRTHASGSLYRVGLALLDRNDPRRCIARSDSWVLGPETEYERVGDVAGVVFPCGFTIDEDGDTLNLYYGAADTSIALARGSIREMVDWLKSHPACRESL